MANTVVPVCSPVFLEKNQPLASPEDIKKLTLLHSRYRSTDWAEWFAHIGIEFATRPGLVFAGSTLAYQAAKKGIGIAMGQYRLLEAEIAAGTLVIPFDDRLERASGYFLLHSKRGLHDPKILVFPDWIMEEAAQ